MSIALFLVEGFHLNIAPPRTAGAYAWSTSAHLVHPYDLLGQQHSSKNPSFFPVHEKFLEVSGCVPGHPNFTVLSKVSF